MTGQKIIYLMRHGDAYSESLLISPDSDDLLTSWGKQKLEILGKGIRKEQGNNLGTKIYHSPLPKENESARILADTIAIPSSNILERESLRCNNYKIKEIVDEIAGDKIASMGVIISHRPDILDYLHQIDENGVSAHHPNFWYYYHILRL